MTQRFHAPGCRYEGTDQPCDSAMCREVVMQGVRVLLTDAYVFLTPDKPGFDVHVKGNIALVWREKYEKLMAHLGTPVNPFTGRALDGSDDPRH